jgi:tetratricopeptide (TPR) repeat protein
MLDPTLRQTPRRRLLGLIPWLVLGFAVLSLNPQPAAATDAASHSQCAPGEALSEAGEVNEAKKAFVEVLKEDPTSKCASASLKELNAPPPKDEASWPTQAANAVIDSIPTVLVFAGLIALAWYLLLFACRWDWLKQKLVSVWVLGDQVKYMLRPRLSFASFTDGAVDGSPGVPLTARVKERLGRMRDEALSKSGPEYDLDFGTPREEFADQVAESKTLQTALDSASEVSDQTKLVAALIKLLSVFLPIRRFAVSGALEPPATAGPALTLVLEEEGKSESSTHLQGPSLGADPVAKDYMTLAGPAAVWLQYEIACSLTGEDGGPTRAESQALLREGLDRYQRDDIDGARSAFEQAIVLDHTNWGAYVSLAVAEARIGGNYAKSVDGTLRAIEDMRVIDA